MLYLAWPSMSRETVPTAARARARFLHSSEAMMESVSQAWYSWVGQLGTGQDMAVGTGQVVKALEERLAVWTILSRVALAGRYSSGSGSGEERPNCSTCLLAWTGRQDVTDSG